MSPKKDAWEAESWEELQELTELETVKSLLFARNRQRERDKKNNKVRRAAYNLVKDNPELLKQAQRLGR